MRQTVQDYIQNIRRFSPQARLYLLVMLLQGMGWGIFRLFFNFYILSLGYPKDFLGVLISIPSLTALLVALIAGYLSDWIGRKLAFISGGLLIVLSQGAMLIFPNQPMLIVSSVVQGIGSSIFNVTASPFLMEHSTEAERTHLFSFNSGVRMMSNFLGNFVGGGLPLLFSRLMTVPAESSQAYAWSLGVTSLLTGLALIPLMLLKVKPRDLGADPMTPLRALWSNRLKMTQLLLPGLIISLGAGMLIPFMNVFFRERYGLADEVIGTLFGFSSLGMGLAIFGAPILAERWGKAKTVVMTRALSIPFLVAMGYVFSLPLAIVSFLSRSALMNLSNPVYQTMVMEEVDEDSRGIAASLNSMIWSLGWAISPSISGPLQTRYGFAPVFAVTIVTYAISIYMVYVWFVRARTPSRALMTQSG
jgi:MFS family permease